MAPPPEVAPPLTVAPEWATLRRVIAELRGRREAQGLSRTALAQRVGVKTSYLAHVERGEADPRYMVLADLARELGTTIGEVFGRADSAARPWAQR